MKKICLECFTLDELVEALKSAVSISSISSTTSTEISESNVLTRKEAACLLSITLSTLNAWTKQNRISAYRKGTRVYYKKDELIASLEKINHQHYKTHNQN